MNVPDLRKTFHFAAGFFGVFLARSAFSDFALFATCLTYAAILYAAFFPSREGRPWSALVGATAAIELLGNAKFGTGALYGAYAYGIALLFADIARFTSPYARFIVALSLLMAGYPLILLVPAHFLSSLPQLALVIILTGGVAALLRHRTRTSEYELA